LNLAIFQGLIAIVALDPDLLDALVNVLNGGGNLV
jgi:hypothetical protein